MNWWDHLTQAQATLLGGLAVLGAGVLAFSNGWFDRNAQQRRLHYDEVKAVYREVLELALIVRQSATMKADRESGKLIWEATQRLRNAAVQLQLTGDYETAGMVFEYAREQAAFAAARRTKQPEPGMTISRRQLEVRLRRELAAYLPRWSKLARTLRKDISELTAFGPPYDLDAVDEGSS